MVVDSEDVDGRILFPNVPKQERKHTGTNNGGFVVTLGTIIQC